MLVLIAVFAAAVAAQNRNHLDTLLNKTGPLRANAESLLTALVDQETGIRGYAVSGDRTDLVPYTSGLEIEKNAARGRCGRCSMTIRTSAASSTGWSSRRRPGAPPSRSR